MKKIIIAMAIAAVSFMTHAASVAWNSAALKAPGADGVKGTSNAIGAQAFFFDLTGSVETYNKWAAMSYADASASIWDTYSKNLGTAVATSSILGSANYSQTVENASGMHYGAVIYTYTDANDQQWYIANIGSANVTGSGSVTVANLGSTFGGTAGGTIGAWTAVPEPTSGLLLLLGMAGLALKRKRA